MVGNHRIRRGLPFVVVLAALAIFLPSGAPAQSDKMEGKSGSAPSGQQPKPGKISEEDLRKLRQLEVKSGARTKAAEAPEVQALKGPPLSDREKVIHVLNRMSFGPRPGEVDKVLAEGGWVTERELKQTAPRAAAPGLAAPAQAADGFPDGDDIKLSARERDHIRQVLERSGGNKMATARALGLDRRTLYRRLDRYGLGSIARRSSGRGSGA